MTQPIRFAYYTSTHEPAEEGVRSPTNNGVNPNGIMGNLEFLLNALGNPRTAEERRFASNFELGAILVEVRGSKFEGRDPFELERLGERLGIPVYIINTDSMRRKGLTPEQRAAEKATIEQHINGLLEQHECDILTLDRAMIKIGPTLLSHFENRVFNTHPANTFDRELRGTTPTMNALERARNGGRSVTGATFHEVNAEFDDGAHIHMEEATHIDLSRHNSVEALRADNYNCEHIVFLRGMNKVASRDGVEVCQLVSNPDGTDGVKNSRRNYVDMINSARAERHARSNPIAQAQESFQRTKEEALGYIHAEATARPVPVPVPISQPRIRTRG